MYAKSGAGSDIIEVEENYRYTYVCEINVYENVYLPTDIFVAYLRC